MKGRVEQVAIGEVLDHEAIRITPVVEELTTLDVAPDSPGPEISLLREIFAAGGQRVQIAYLIGRVHIAVLGAQGQRQRVVIGRRRTAIASDEAHGGPTVALAWEVQEVADDHAEGVEIPVQRLEVFRRLHDEVTEPLHRGRLPTRALGGVDAAKFVSHVVAVQSLRRQHVEGVHSGHHTHRHTARVGEIDRHATDGCGQRPGLCTGRGGQPQQIPFVGSGKRNSQKPAPASAAHDYARCGRIAATQMQFLAGS
ncbi:Uncharacterised protein [Mycobacteroides abscessus subsp. abscessus]|nr:Uncharacterised protein [Mycobacteroides abscessus subsp. abscessus]